jgi:hypothetical protein
MRNIIHFSKLTFLFCIYFSFTSCESENNEENKNKSTTYEIKQENKVFNKNGILEFGSFADFSSIYQELLSKYSNVSLGKIAYADLGIDINIDNLYTEYPINTLFEKSHNFTSFRKKEEIAYFKFIRLGGDPIDFKKNKTYADVNFKTLINEDGEVKIGKKYFKIYDDNTILVVGNDDFKTFSKLRLKRTNEISTEFNVRVLDFKNGDKNYLFNITDKGLRVEKDVIDLKIDFTKNDKNEIRPINKSFVDFVNNNDFQYKWEFSDKSIHYGITPNKILRNGEMVKLCLLENGVEIKNIIKYVNQSNSLRGPLPCDHTIRTTISGNCNVDIIIEIAWSDDVIGRVEWILPNGAVLSGTKTTIGNVLNTTEIGNPFTVTVNLYDMDGIWLCTQTHGVICNDCGVSGDDSDKSDEVLISGKKWRADVEIWCHNNLFVTSLGSETKSMRKGFFGFTKTDCNLLFASFQGTIQDADKPGCPDIIIPYTEETETNGGVLQRNVTPPTPDPQFLENMNRCESKHWFKVGSTTVTYTKNGGKLFLNSQ